jgi:hypothetical protein
MRSGESALPDPTLRAYRIIYDHEATLPSMTKWVSSCGSPTASIRKTEVRSSNHRYSRNIIEQRTSALEGGADHRTQ